MPIDRPDLQDLAESPPEVLHVDLKDWMYLNEGISRAKIAGHLAALANHGGGYLLFGFRDDRTPNPRSPFSLQTFSRDNISSIIRRYRIPTFQCEVGVYHLKRWHNSPGRLGPLTWRIEHWDESVEAPGPEQQ